VTGRPASETLRLDTDRRIAHGGGRVVILGVEPPWDWIRRGRNATVRVSVRNPGPEPANRTLVVRVDESRVATESVRLAPGERAEVPIGFAAERGVVSVDGVVAGRIAVGETPRTPAASADPATAQSSEASDWSSLPLGMLAGVGALAGIVLAGATLAVRRQ
jgi:hypothetical protein